MGLQANFSKDLTRTYLGETKVDAQGNTVFEKAPLLQKMAIYKQGDPNSADEVRKDGVNTIAQNGSIVGLDFNDPNLGAVTLTATKGKGDVNPELYTGIVPDVHLKNNMAPVHKFTQAINRTLLNKMSPEERKENLESASDTFKNTIEQAIANPNFSEKDKEAYVKQLNAIYSDIINNNRGVAVGQSFDGKYKFIGSSTIRDGVPNKKVLRIDNFGNFDTVDLGDIQYEESAAIQMLHAPGYNESAPGYETRKQTYTDR
jgi:hypothetical protein